MQHLCDLRNAIPLHWSPATSHPPFYRECYGSERPLFTLRRFLPFHSFLLFKSSPRNRQFNLKVSRTSSLFLKHSPGPTICLNHNDPRRFICSRFYLRARVGQSRNINLCRKLVYGTLVLKCLLLTGSELFSQ